MMLESCRNVAATPRRSCRVEGIKAGKFQAQWDAMIQKIEQAEPGKEKLITFEEARQYGVKKPGAAGAQLKETK